MPASPPRSIPKRARLREADGVCYNRRSIPYVAIVGSDELARQTVTLKDMRTGEQRQVPFAELAASLRSNDRIATESCGGGVRPGLAAPLRRMNQGEL